MDEIGGDEMITPTSSVKVEMVDKSSENQEINGSEHIKKRTRVKIVDANNLHSEDMADLSDNHSVGQNLKQWQSRLGGSMQFVEDGDQTLIKFGFEPDFLRSVFWGLFLTLLIIGKILTDTLSDVDYDNNPIKDTFGTNNPCLWLDYPPSTYITPSLWVIASNIYLLYCLFRWYRTTVAYRDKSFNNVGKWEYRLYTVSIWVEAATVIFFSTVFSIGPEEDIVMHTLPYSIVSIGACLNVVSDFWYLTRVAGRRDWFWQFMLCYTVLTVMFTFFKVHSELVVVGGPLNPYPFGVQGPWIFTVIPCNLFISMISGKHTKDMQITIAIPRDAHEWSREDQAAKHGFFGGLVNEPVFCWILMTLGIVGYFMAYSGEVYCLEITEVGMWGVIRGIIYVGTIIFLLAGIVIYWKSNLCCLSSDFKSDLKLWHKVDLREDVNPAQSYTRSTIARAKRPVRVDLEEWWEDRLIETEDYLIKPLMFVLLLKHLSLTNSRLGGDENGAPGNGVIGLCTFGQISFFLYFCNWLWQIKYEDRGEKLRWPKAKLLHGQLFILWCVFVGFIRTIAAWTGEFEQNYFGRECDQGF